MSEHEAEIKLVDLVPKVEAMLRIAWLIGGAVVFTTGWMVKQEFTDNAQNEMLLRHERELDARSGWMRTVDERLTRIEERQQSNARRQDEANEMLKQLLRQRGNE